ncbi:MAG: helix-turn-helix transcriptional regulator [Planctomycetales bacterium]
MRASLGRATKDSLWISYEKELTKALLQHLLGHARPLGVFVHETDPASHPTLASLFKKVAFVAKGGFLPPDQLAAALHAANRSELFIGGSVDPSSRTVTLWRGDLEPLTVPFSAFEKSGDGTEPDFDRFAVTDFGQTVRLGDYEAGTDAILYEFDAGYRRRIARERRESERSFGASVRRLRKQRGLRRDDFGPEVAAKTIARIEQGKVQRVRTKTLETIAKRLRVKPVDIESY